MANYLVTGAAGFIGARTSEFLIRDGHTVVGVDNLNEAYDPRVKEYRLNKLQALEGFTFHKRDISEKSILDQFKNHQFDGVINLAARAGGAPVAVGAGRVALLVVLQPRYGAARHPLAPFGRCWRAELT